MSRPLRWSPVTITVVVLLLALNLALSRVLFLPGERIYRGSIEPGYAAMGRFLSEHPNPMGWKPEQYCGLPTQHAYLPVLPYLTALGIRVAPQLEPVQVYRLLTVSLACLGPLAVFFFVSYFTRRQLWAAAAALSYTVFSPIYLLVERLSLDAGIAQLPARLHAQIKYGEAPHMIGLAVVPPALVLLHAAARSGQARHLAAATVAVAAISLTNWIATLSLAWCVVLLLVCRSARPLPTDFRTGYALGALAWAWALAAVWQHPSLILTVASHWASDSFGYRLGTAQAIALAALAVGVAVLPTLLRRLGADYYLTFLLTAAFTFGFVSLGYYWFGLETIPEARRYVPETDLFLTLAGCELARRALSARLRLLALLALAAGLAVAALGARQVWRFLTKPALELTPLYSNQEAAEFRLTQWLAEQRPRGRIFATGGLRYRLNAWSSLAQVGGTFDTSVPNRAPQELAYQILSGEGNRPGEEGVTAVMQLQALGVEYVVVHQPDSKEFYRDFRQPFKFEGLLERVYDRDGDAIYRVPFRSLARLVRREELPAVLPKGEHVKLLAPLAEALEDRRRPTLEAAWRSPTELELVGAVPEGMLVSVAASFHPGWRAFQDDRPVPVERDVLGFLLIPAQPAASTRILLRYRPTAEQWAAAALSAAAWLGVPAFLLWSRRRGVRA